MFRTELSIVPATDQLSRTARVLTVGSCFADSIGLRLAANKVETLANPFGTVFQPLALGRLLRAAAGEDVDWQQHLVEARGRWQSYDLHGSIGADSPVELLQAIQELVRRTGEFLRSADVVLITLGTAWAYRLRETGELVNNCHKQSADLFVRELLTPDEIINGLAETHAYLRRINPKLRFVLTVSPVRHLKDTLPMNAVSKSVLRVATHFVSDLLPGVAYFPAYELLLDDLRDYRFYAADMLHPSEIAEDYIWEKFTRTYFDADFGRFRKEWAAVQQSLGHRPLHPGAPEHRQFLENTLGKLEQLSSRRIEVAAELSQVHTQLAALPIPRQPELAVVQEDNEERIDIGDGSAPADAPKVTVPSAAQPLTEDRPPRLSPEEFRAQRSARSDRGRRDGRGKGQQAVPTENEQFQASTQLTDEQLAAQPFADTTTLPGAVDSDRIERATELGTTITAPSVDVAEGSEEPGQKKKRRSRGGAKRTARKNALRLAAGEITAADLTEVSDSTAETATSNSPENRDALPESRESTGVTNSEQVQRGGRRNGPGRLPRTELYAAVNTPTNAEALSSLETELSATETPVTEVEATSDAPANEPKAADFTSRNNRNRNNRRGGADVDATPRADLATAEAVDNVGQESPGAPISTPEPVAVTTTQRPSRNRARAVSAARSEKPAIDTPVIPVPDSLHLRTQVAAGRMTGSSASLIKPTEMPKKAVATKEVVPPKKEVIVSVRPTKKAPALVIAPANVAIPPQVPAPVAKPEPIAKAKAMVAKSAVAKLPVTKVPTTKALAQVPTAKASIAKAPAAKAPVAKAPAAKASIAKAPAVKAPVVKAPAVKAPVAKAPAVKAPAVKAPAAKVIVAKVAVAKVLPAKVPVVETLAPKKAAAVKPKPIAQAKAAVPKPTSAKVVPKAVVTPTAAKKPAAKPAAAKPKPPKKPAKPA